MRKTILITGGAGFIGSHTADALSRLGYKIRILDSLEAPTHQKPQWPAYVFGKGYELIKGDVCSPQALKKALKGVNFVYHLAAYQDQRHDFSRFFKVNTLSSALLYEVIVENKLPVKKVVLASTQFVYGDGQYSCAHSKKGFFPEPRALSLLRKGDWSIKCSHGAPAKFLPFQEDQKLTPTNSYGLSKQALENLSLRFGKTYNIPTTILRYSIVQGPRQSPHNLYSGAMRIFASQALAKVPLTVYEDGLETRDFVNIEDVVRANLLVLKNPKTNFEIFNVGGGKGYKVLDFAKLVKKMSKSTSPIIIGAFRRTDTRHAVSDISKLKKLGWTPRRDTTYSIKTYLDWFLKSGFDKKLHSKDLIKLQEGIKS
ncbi:MAG: NAD-dependent epimerase/dehydratase family protein [Patescibacteria group bacterium]